MLWALSGAGGGIHMPTAFEYIASVLHLKTAAPCRGERVEKYNQLMRIEENSGAMAVYAGHKDFVH